MSAPRPAEAAAVRRPPRSAVTSGAPIQLRFLAIWIGLLVLVALGAVVAPRSLLPSTFLAIIPLAAFLTICSVGEALVGISAGRDANLLAAIVGALLFAILIGAANGILISVFELNALIVTLAVGAMTSGATLWYRDALPAEARVPPLMAAWGDARLFGLNVAVWVAAALIVILTIVLRKTPMGRRFCAAGANPRAAWVAGVNVCSHKLAAYVAAGLFYGIVGILLSAFIRNPTLRVGEPYLLAPIAAAVLGGTAISGGIGSMIAVSGAALFLTQLGQMLKMLGLSSALQYIIEGVAIAFGMAFAGFNLQQTRLWLKRMRNRFG